MDIVERLRAHPGEDHHSGCLGRQYYCDCGYGTTTEGLLGVAADEIAKLRAELRLAQDIIGDLQGGTVQNRNLIKGNHNA